MPKRRARNPRLTDRDYEILSHIMRYRLTTPEVLHKLFFHDLEPNAVTKVTSRLTDNGFLNRFDLCPPRSYFVLGSKSRKCMGISTKKTRELGPQALVQEYATLAYCCLAAQQRTRLTVSEIRQKSPDLLQEGLDSSHYYLDNDGETKRLAFLRVDFGGTPENIVRKCKDDLEVRYPYSAFKDLIDNDRFLIAIATGREEKSAAIHECLKRHSWPVKFRIEVVSDLVQLIARFEGDV